MPLAVVIGTCINLSRCVSLTHSGANAAHSDASRESPGAVTGYTAATDSNDDVDYYPTTRF